MRAGATAALAPLGFPELLVSTPESMTLPLASRISPPTAPSLPPSDAAAGCACAAIVVSGASTAGPPSRRGESSLKNPVMERGAASKSGPRMSGQRCGQRAWEPGHCQHALESCSCVCAQMPSADCRRHGRLAGTSRTENWHGDWRRPRRVVTMAV
ncbi:hypothetical protein FA09DRAFT_34384 [Tilletiopsis washingtonensis]|uniref:Uncharacterized protein n=1 Tax=Tilletiopsis washingtonensis TaxID=58919 RepID=A0A316Z9K2_9BASI|nr:hypothetical protein FA09DRAFT_34384 [Tilletiopsis washingtonensis]PWN97966.1 hypothetical protein FA09DRAFT_34384 [Tilletiopsis washingtonensis]